MVPDVARYTAEAFYKLLEESVRAKAKQLHKERKQVQSDLKSMEDNPKKGAEAKLVNFLLTHKSENITIVIDQKMQ
jgi:CHAD domain-containing protein